MFVENTGTHMLDSGGAYGRQWQRNQKACGEREPMEWLASQPEARITDHDCRDNRYKYIGVTVSTYHFLESCTSPDVDLTEAFRKWCESEDEYMNSASAIDRWVSEGCPMTHDDAACPDCGGNGEVENDDYDDDDPDSPEVVDCSTCDGTGECTAFAPKWDPDEIDTPWGGRDGEGPVLGNTYNDENCLSQDFMFCGWCVDGTEYVAISIHGGCDARGGYTDFMVFEVTEEYGWSDYARCGLYATCLSNDNDPHDTMSWHSDDGGNNYYPNNDEPQLEDLPWISGAEWMHSENVNEDGTIRDCVILLRSKDYAYRVLLAYDGELYELEGCRF